MSDWQPIETAPRDGTEILLLGNSNLANKDYYIENGYFWKYQKLCEWNVEIMDANGKAFMWMPLPDLPQLNVPQPKGSDNG